MNGSNVINGSNVSTLRLPPGLRIMISRARFQQSLDSARSASPASSEVGAIDLALEPLANGLELEPLARRLVWGEPALE